MYTKCPIIIMGVTCTIIHMYSMHTCTLYMYIHVHICTCMYNTCTFLYMLHVHTLYMYSKSCTCNIPLHVHVPHCQLVGIQSRLRWQCLGTHRGWSGYNTWPDQTHSDPLPTSKQRTKHWYMWLYNIQSCTCMCKNIHNLITHVQ